LASMPPWQSEQGKIPFEKGGLGTGNSVLAAVFASTATGRNTSKRSNAHR
jgi:hypothetical protein